MGLQAEEDRWVAGWVAWGCRLKRTCVIHDAVSRVNCSVQSACSYSMCELFIARAPPRPAAASPPSLAISASTDCIAAPAAGLMSALRPSWPGTWPTSSSDTCSRPARYLAAPAHAAPSIVLAGRPGRWPGLRPSSRRAVSYRKWLTSFSCPGSRASSGCEVGGPSARHRSRSTRSWLVISLRAASYRATKGCCQ